uniref:Uncharacterized protein n=1 Tax=Anguilla anguilla TaxID=7936 RepID=A0A0E9T4G5_ANGAN
MCLDAPVDSPQLLQVHLGFGVVTHEMVQPGKVSVRHNAVLCIVLRFPPQSLARQPRAS